jgi:hypothetical protein
LSYDEDSLEVDDEAPWLIDWPIFIAAFLAPSIACFTLYLSLACKSLSLYYYKVFNADSIA